MVEELGCILDELKQKLPLLEDVANPAFQPRHWIEIHELLDTLDVYCPVEVERRRRMQMAQESGEPADLSDLVLACLPGHSLPCARMRLHGEHACSCAMICVLAWTIIVACRPVCSSRPAVERQQETLESPLAGCALDCT